MEADATRVPNLTPTSRNRKFNVQREGHQRQAPAVCVVILRGLPASDASRIDSLGDLHRMTDE